MPAPFNAAKATGKMYGKDWNGYITLKSFYPIVTKVFVPRGAEKKWYNLNMPLDDMKDFISGAKEYHGFMLVQKPAVLESFNCTNKYYISSENDSTHLRPKMVVIYGDTPVSTDPSVLKNENLMQSIFYHANNDIIINAGLPDDLQLSVYNVQGKLIASKSLKNEASVFSLNSLVQNHSDGIYFCTLNYAGIQYSLKLYK